MKRTAFLQPTPFKGKFVICCATENISSFILAVSKYSLSVCHILAPHTGVCGRGTAGWRTSVRFKICWNSLVALRLASDLTPFLFSPYFSLQELECLSYACPIIVLWKHITSLVLQVYSRSGIFSLRINHILSLTISDLDDTEMRFWILRVDSGKS